jgi:hypothetical protein
MHFLAYEQGGGHFLNTKGGGVQTCKPKNLGKRIGTLKAGGGKKIGPLARIYTPAIFSYLFETKGFVSDSIKIPRLFFGIGVPLSSARVGRRSGCRMSFSNPRFFCVFSKSFQVNIYNYYTRIICV